MYPSQLLSADQLVAAHIEALSHEVDELDAEITRLDEKWSKNRERRKAIVEHIASLRVQTSSQLDVSERSA